MWGIFRGHLFLGGTGLEGTADDLLQKGLLLCLPVQRPHPPHVIAVASCYQADPGLSWLPERVMQMQLGFPSSPQVSDFPVSHLSFPEPTHACMYACMHTLSSFSYPLALTLISNEPSTLVIVS